MAERDWGEFDVVGAKIETLKTGSHYWDKHEHKHKHKREQTTFA